LARYWWVVTTTDLQGALQLLAGKPCGSASPWLLGVGFAAYAPWRTV
jgi:hypothetical protein